MNLMLLKNNLIDELKKYNYVLGLKLLTIYLNKLSVQYSHDLQSSKILTDFAIFLANNPENEQNGFDMLYQINNINIIIKLLCFFNPDEFYRIGCSVNE